MDHSAPLHSLISGRNPRTINDEWDIAQLSDLEHLVESLGPLYQLSPWEIKSCFDELAKRNPHPHQHPAHLDGSAPHQFERSIGDGRRTSSI